MLPTPCLPSGKGSAVDRTPIHPRSILPPLAVVGLDAVAGGVGAVRLRPLRLPI